MSDKQTNPFFALISEENEGEQGNREDPDIDEGPSKSFQIEKDKSQNEVEVAHSTNTDKVQSISFKDPVTAGINKLAEDVFNITLTKDNESLNNGRVPHLIFLQEIIESLAPGSFTDVGTLKMVVFERLFLTDPVKYLVRSKVNLKNNINSHTIQRECILYLYECYKRLIILVHSKESDIPSATLDSLISFVIESVSTAVRQPQLFEKQNVHRQASCEITISQKWINVCVFYKTFFYCSLCYCMK